MKGKPKFYFIPPGQSGVLWSGWIQGFFHVLFKLFRSFNRCHCWCNRVLCIHSIHCLCQKCESTNQILAEIWNPPYFHKLFFVTFEDGRVRTKLTWKPNKPFGCSVTLERAFQTMLSPISSSDCCMVLHFMPQMGQEARGVGVKGEKLQLEISMRL